MTDKDVLILNLDMQIVGEDDEIDCMQCLNTVMDHYKKLIDQAEMERIAAWFGGKYSE